MSTDKPLARGDRAPDFELNDQSGAEIKLSEVLKEGHAALVFFPLAFSDICSGELCDIRDNLRLFESVDAQVLAISVDSKFTLQAWSRQKSFRFRLLSDFWPHGAVAKAYGVFLSELGVANRATFLVNRDGIIHDAIITEPGKARDLERYRLAVSSLK